MTQVNLFTAGAVIIIILLIYHHLAKKYHYFLPKPIPCMKPSFLVGSSGPVLLRRQGVTTFMKTIYNSFPEANIFGMYSIVMPVYIVRDPELIKLIGVKDFDHFVDHAFVSGNSDDDGRNDTLFGNSLIALSGLKWRDMRATLSPAFTGSKMRHMFELVADCGRSMVEFFKAEEKAGKSLEYEMKATFARYGNDVIASVAFGVTVDSMRDPQNDFNVMAKKMLDFANWKILVRIAIIQILSLVSKKFNFDIVDGTLSRYFRGIITDNMERREAQGIVRNDMVDMLMKVRKGTLKHQKDEQDTKDTGFATVEESSVGKTTHSRKWTDNELIAQCFLFFLAGFDTTSNLLSWLMYELTVNPAIQDRLYEEISQIENSLLGKHLSYEALQKMSYLDMVVSEALRKWPPNVQLDRKCTKDYLLDNGTGTRFTMDKGSSVLIPVYAIHHDPKYYSNPERFDPERFSEENRSKINAGAYLPFGIGPRNCIGSRLALMQVKSIVYHLLKDFEAVSSEKTGTPLKLAKHPFLLQAENGIWVQLKSRSS
ncbi:cytochrome P450 9e2-like isoform X4 [Culex pipiens pallens]|uniref:cytochrome P450 9e2-like isoform X4 n=1 Tax=Culex pipiens pallens TaxID=42434 RepID=UPI0019546E3D|nr:cytochrome P450 9e2-like isoform X4 [Culex pipiens pallens]